MGNQNDPKSPAPPTPAQPTMTDVMALIQAMQASQEKMAALIAEGVKAGISNGMAMAGMARENADPIIANARAARKNLGPLCHKCRMPTGVCGGPEMKKVETQKLDADGKPELKDGKPVMLTTMVEATKPNEPDANHVKMVVLPDDPNAARWFQWIGVNGVRFQSRSRGRAILVPRKNDFASILNTFSRFEEDFRQARKVRFNQGGRWNPRPIAFAGKNSPLNRGPRLAS